MPHELHPVQQSDIPRLVTIYFDSFQNPCSLACWPRTPNVRKAWEDMIRKEMQDSTCSFLKIVDPDLVTTTTTTTRTSDINNKHVDSDGNESIIAWAKWIAPKYHVDNGEESPTEPIDSMILPEEADKELCDEVFGAWAREKTRLMGSRPHWYLELLATHPQHQRRGAAKLLMNWGVQRADRDNVEAYTEATPEGLGIYERFGFQEQSFLDTKIRNGRVEDGREVLFRSVFMIRLPDGGSGGKGR